VALVSVKSTALPSLVTDAISSQVMVSKLGAYCSV
jgi:hypothetical protein